MSTMVAQEREGELPERWSAKAKAEVVLRLFRGEAVETSPEWLVWDSGSMQELRLRMPSRFRALAILTGSVCGVQLDDNDVESIACYAIERRHLVEPALCLSLSCFGSAVPGGCAGQCRWSWRKAGRIGEEFLERNQRVTAPTTCTFGPCRVWSVLRV